MFKKAIFTTVAAAALAATAFGTSAIAGGYGYGNNYGNSYGNNHGGGYGGYQQERTYDNGRKGNWQQHVDWCYGRYNSYRANDNSYQPYAGPRQQCWSPYYQG
ncbi:BA14K family protein [Roseibium sp. M-1]